MKIKNMQKSKKRITITVIFLLFIITMGFSSQNSWFKPVFQNTENKPTILQFTIKK